MKFKKYVIEHTKDSYGRDEYRIYKVYLGCIKFRFDELDLVHTTFGYKLQVHSYVYESLKSAKEAIELYENDSCRKYKGFTLTRCHGDLWVSNVDKYAVDDLGIINEYKAAGTLSFVQRYIDVYLEKQSNIKFKEAFEV